MEGRIMFANINPGDLVILCVSGNVGQKEPRKEITKVSKVTPKFFDVNGVRFKKSDGQPQDFSTYWRYSIIPYTRMREVEMALGTDGSDVSRCRNFRFWHRLSVSDIQEVIKIISKYENMED